MAAPLAAAVGLSHIITRGNFVAHFDIYFSTPKSALRDTLGLLSITFYEIVVAQQQAPPLSLRPYFHLVIGLARSHRPFLLLPFRSRILYYSDSSPASFPALARSSSRSSLAKSSCYAVNCRNEKLHFPKQFTHLRGGGEQQQKRANGCRPWAVLQ